MRRLRYWLFLKWVIIKRYVLGKVDQRKLTSELKNREAESKVLELTESVLTLTRVVRSLQLELAYHRQEAIKVYANRGLPQQ